ncbi:lipase family protein [Thalassotalea atypica]|uniref:lipase family protein n=1 Tax=Thalassotalea atypica TaxID=2054316 RepID=UPI0025723D26|nr:hypothetical protein [Thalassotalea atypica]
MQPKLGPHTTRKGLKRIIRYGRYYPYKKIKEYLLKVLDNDNQRKLAFGFFEAYLYIAVAKKQEQKNKLQSLNLLVDEDGWFNNDQTGTRALMLCGENYLVLTFRGTEATIYEDIKTDAKSRVVGSDVFHGKVHEGFLKTFDSVEGDIAKGPKKQSNRDKPLFITGHSLGGR